MSETATLKHDFDLNWFRPLDIDQLHYLFFYMSSINKFLAPPPKNTSQQQVKPGGVHSWEDLAFFVNSKCPDSPQLSTETYLKAWSYFSSIQTKEPIETWRLKYSRLIQTFPDLWISFMNYGYYDFETNNTGLELKPEDEGWRFAIQLYNRLVCDTQIKGKDLLEIGCGRGGGASFISRYHEPASYTGTDGTMSNVMFCQKAHNVSNLKFKWCKAEKLSFEDQSFDVVVNLESCNYYDPFSTFVREVHRVLRPDGRLLLSAFDTPENMRWFSTQIQKYGFELIKMEEMSFHVAVALREFNAGKELFANSTTIRRKHMYYEKWQELYNVPPILSGHARYPRFIFRKR